VKLFVNSIAVFIAGLVLLGLYTDFLVTEDIVNYFVYGGVGFSLLIVISILIKITKERSLFRQRMRDQGKSTVLGIVAVIVMVPLMVVTAFSKGLPVALNYLVGSPGEIEVTVRSKPAGYYDKRCSGSVDLQEYEYFLNDRICGVSEADWRRLRKWDKLVLVGKKSLFGIQYYQYKFQLNR
jgi:hypothetical protein